GVSPHRLARKASDLRGGPALRARTPGGRAGPLGDDQSRPATVEPDVPAARASRRRNEAGRRQRVRPVSATATRELTGREARADRDRTWHAPRVPLGSQ